MKKLFLSLGIFVTVVNATDYWYKGASYYQGRAEQARSLYEKKYGTYDPAVRVTDPEQRFAGIYLAKRVERARYQKVLFPDTVSESSGRALGNLAEYVKSGQKELDPFLELLKNARTSAKDVTEKRAADLCLSHFPNWLDVALRHNMGPTTFYSERDVFEYGSAQSAALLFPLIGVDRHANLIQTTKSNAVIAAMVDKGLDMNAKSSDGFTVCKKC